MDQCHAGQIATLLNTRNQLVKNYDAKAILAARARFLFEVRDDQVVGCVEVKKVQWYQAEVNHLTVHEDYCRQGIAQALLDAATARAIKDRARILQCTIRDNNDESAGLFLKNGFVRTTLFLYPDTGNNVGVYQKVISPAKAAGLSAAMGA
ncbi:GNAT family N-acetyltransferase [Pararhizobium sp. O133]|uniref:GNAT family N-acetyltransferase n=1 Tax=Pararhizobium sp. O133 TaxID=3449278 RepID=UPI003F686590